MSMTPEEPNRLDDEPIAEWQLAELEATRDFTAQNDTDAPAIAPQSLGEFHLIRELGRGGMGAVYEAQDSSLGRRVALKVLRFGALGDRAAVERFGREAATVAKLHHTNIVPIFSVGSHESTHFYAMQLIEGRNLSEVLRQGPVDCRRAAQWALQAAEALAHAHRHGVTHRDVKPSNLIVDADDRLWLTDFGLARSLDDSVLTATDAMLGTPRYMSPEQASLKRDEIDGRTDIYSLGATLYELIAGRPPFGGDSPHQAIQAILTSEADPPRRLRADLPRDLDTIVMKCLARNRADRYATADDLVDDLRAFLDGRAIRARRPSAAEQVMRWLRQRRREAALVLGTGIAIVVITLTARLILDARRRANLGSVAIDTRWPPLVADLTDEAGTAVEGAISVPTQKAIDVPAANYHLRLRGERRFDESLALSVSRGKSVRLDVNLEDQLLSLAHDVPRSYLLVPGDGATHLLLLGNRVVSGLEREPGFSGWGRSFAGEPARDSTGSLMSDLTPRQMTWRGPLPPGSLWPWDAADGLDLRPLAPDKRMNVDGDDHADYILAARHQAWLCALSAGGRPLWFSGRGSDLAKPVDPVQRRKTGLASAVLSSPLAVGDLDQDDVGDLLVTFIDRFAPDGAEQPRRWIEALSGASGKTIWRHDIHDQLFELPAGEEPAYVFRWFYDFVIGRGFTRSGDYVANEHVAYRDVRRYHERNGPYLAAPQPPTLVRWRDHHVACVLAGKHALVVDLQNGRPVRGPIELPARPVCPVTWSDVNGDGLPEVIAVAERLISPQRAGNTQIFIGSLADGQTLWRADIDADFGRQDSATPVVPAWPISADLDGDGRAELLVPNGSSHSRGGIEAPPPWGAIEARDAATGALRWKTRVMNIDQQSDHFLTGPDIDGDGCRDVFAAGLWGRRADLFVDALSGRDGRTLWRGSLPLAGSDAATNWSWGQSVFITRLDWWSVDHDGWPRLLVVVTSGRGTADPTRTLALFSSATGAVLGRANGFTQFDLADIDGDGADDLLHLVPNNEQQPDLGGELEVISGAAARWRRAGAALVPIADFDGDGVTDMVSVEEGGPGSAIQAIAGASGTTLWKNRIAHDGPVSQVHVEPCYPREAAESLTGQAMDDLDGDGIADLFIVGEMSFNRYVETAAPLWAISGKTGHVLWRAGAIAGFGAMPLIAANDLDGDGALEIVIVVTTNLAGHAAPWGRAEPLRLCVLSGRDGSLKWLQNITPNTPSDIWLRATRFQPALGDLNRDGVADIIVPGSPDKSRHAVAMRAFDGATGAPLWSHKLPDPEEFPPRFKNIPPPLVVDLDKDGNLEVYVLSFENDAEAVARAAAILQSNVAGGAADAVWSVTAKARYARLHSLRGSDGEVLWTWQAETHRPSGNTSDDVDRPRVKRLRRRNGPDWLCLNFMGNGDFEDGQGPDNPDATRPRYKRPQCRIIDARGTLVRQVQSLRGSGGVQPLDIDGDGNDEFLWLCDNDSPALEAISPAEGTAMWRAEIDQIWSAEILNIVPRSAEAPVVVVRDRRGVRGFDVVTGAHQWSCSGLLVLKEPARPIENGLNWSPLKVETSVLDLAGDVAPRHVYFGWESNAFCRPACAPNQPVTRVTLAPPSADPRLARPLPWVSEQNAVPRSARFSAWALIEALGLMLVPTCYTSYLLSRRQFSLLELLFAPLVAGCFIAAWMAPAPRDAFHAAPFVFSVVLLSLAGVRAACLRRWRVLAGWLVLTAALSAALAAAWIELELKHPDQYYLLFGWYWILPYGAYAAAALVCLVTLLAAIARKHRATSAYRKFVPP